MLLVKISLKIVLLIIKDFSLKFFAWRMLHLKLAQRRFVTSI